jgi:cytochrome c556
MNHIKPQSGIPTNLKRLPCLLEVTIARTRNRVFADTPFEHHRENDMKLWKCAVILAPLLALTGPALAQGDVITARQDGLKGVARQMESIKAVVDQRGDPRATAAAIGEMIGFFDGFTARFPAGSGTGNTRALPAIWTDRAGFETANGNMVTQLRALQAAANAGDQAAFGAAFQQTGATCGACHRPYRAPAR